MPEELALLLAPGHVFKMKNSPFKLINTHNYNNALNNSLNRCCT